jgi:hypothetical protein
MEIFKLLQRYRYLRSTFIHAFVGGASETRFKERLGHLFHEGGYLDRPQQQWQFANARYMPVVYENTCSARQVLAQCGLFDGRRGLAWGSNNAGANRQFAHSLMICEILASIELGARSDPNLQFISWPEILAKAPEKTRNSRYPLRIPVPPSDQTRKYGRIRKSAYLVPDGLFGLEYADGDKKSYRFFALEVDRATMPVRRFRGDQTSFLDKIHAYREIARRQVYKLLLGIPNLLVLTVTPNERHRDRMMSETREIFGGSRELLFKANENYGRFDRAASPIPEMLSESWQRVGFEPLNIADAS